MTAVAAVVFACASALVVAFQVGLALGAPWGARAMGGVHQGRLPGSLRAAVAILALLSVILAVGVLSDAGLILPDLATTLPWIVWAAVAFSALSVVLNTITRSALERRTWLPVAIVMLVSSLAVAVG